MLDKFFQSLFNTETFHASLGSFCLCVGTALLLGALIALISSRNKSFTRSFLITLGLLPALVCVTILMVNGNIGAGVATAGAFSLVRYRSAPGTAKEILLIFFAMVCGLVTGMGYLAYGLLFCAAVSLILLILDRLDPERGGERRVLQITVPEDLDYAGVFDEILDRYCASWKLKQVKSTNLGSLFRLRYSLVLRQDAKEKEFLDALRCRNGNLELSLGMEEQELSGL